MEGEARRGARRGGRERITRIYYPALSHPPTPNFYLGFGFLASCTNGPNCLNTPGLRATPFRVPLRGTHPPAAGPDGAYWYCPGPPTPTPGRGITLERGPCRGFIKPRHGTFPRGFRSPGPPAWPTLGRALGTRALGHPQGHPQKGFLGDDMVRTKWAVNTVGKIGRKGVGRRAASLAHGARGTRHTRRGRPSHSAPTAEGRRRGWRPPPGLGLVHRADGRSRRLA